jgi:hypothetical protein
MKIGIDIAATMTIPIVFLLVSEIFSIFRLAFVIWKMSFRYPTPSGTLFTLIGISLFTYSLAVELPLLKGQHVRTERNTLQP